MNHTNSNSNPNSPTPTPDPLEGLLSDWKAQFECPPDKVARMWARVSVALIGDANAAATSGLMERANGSTEHQFALFDREIGPSDSQNGLAVPGSSSPAGQFESPELANGPSEGESDSKGEGIRSVDTVRRSWWGPMLSGIVVMVAASIALAIGPLFFNGPGPPQADELPVLAATDPLQQFAFSDDELHRTQVLAAEIQRLCSKPVLARKTDSGWDIAEIPTAALEPAGERSTLVIRCLVMESTTADDGTKEQWRVVAQEELITNAEYQHFAAKDQPGDVEAWVHLLPDNSLWAECHDDVRETAFVLQPNKPSVVWQDQSNGSTSRRFVVVYECWDPNDA